VALAAPRLRSAGLQVPEGGGEDPSHRLYELLVERGGGDAHGRYNARSGESSTPPCAADAVHSSLRLARLLVSTAASFVF
jgi:hypothetical protein